MTYEPFTVYKKRTEDIFLCSGCLDANFGTEMVAGQWDERALDECTKCGYVNQTARQEYHEWYLRMEEEDQRLQWEEEEIDNGELK